jgi:7,8-dihydroneopterin aldolase/epimerase/oxygenase
VAQQPTFNQLSSAALDCVALEGMEFFAFHGFYDEEQKIGNKYGVDLRVYVDLSAAAATDSLPRTINYEQLYAAVLTEMGVRARLLEHLGQRILDRVFTLFPHIELAEVSVSKFNPPLGGICERARVTLRRGRS